MIVLKTILKFTLKQVRHVSVQLHDPQGAHYSCLPHLHLVKIANYGTSVCGDVATYVVGPCWCVYVALFGSSLLPNRATYTRQLGITNICSHITNELITHRYT